MYANNNILVLEDDLKRSEAFKLILEFLGENPSFINPKENSPLVLNKKDSGEYMTVCVSAAALESDKTLLDNINRWDSQIAVIVLGELAQSAGIYSSELKHKVIGSVQMPFLYNTIVDILHRARMFREAQSGRDLGDARPRHLFRSLIGTSRSIQLVREMMAQVADKDVTVLITGESGTGKEVVARNLHHHSPRGDKTFVPVNCGAIPAELLESELFGHEKGAFTGAIASRAGRFEMAEGGTLFLDEIGDMPLNMQVKILRVLQERCYERVGSNKTRSINVRVIAATHRNLEDMIESGQFREDLYYRLNVFPIELPALKERAEDLPLLINELVSRLESEQRGSVRFNSAAILSFCRHNWSGNVRELANLVERMAIMYPSAVVGVQDLPAKYRHVEVNDNEFVVEQESVSTPAGIVSMSNTLLLPDQGIDLREYLTHLEQDLIQQALNDCAGVVARAAEKLQIRRTTLVEKMRKYDLHR